jgi:peptidoglycan/LPS O-acetylase OafA/YrhL
MGFHFLTHQDWVPSKIQFYAGFGGYGVDIFFALSGFLICTRILIGMKKYGTLNLKVFYIRRTFRILPPALLYLLFLAILTSFNIINVTKWEFISAMTFWRNYLPIEFAAPLSFTNHFWSLSIEEHFYLFFPFLMIYIPKQRRLYSLIMLALIIAFWRAVDSRYNLLTGISPYLEYNYQFTFARLDNLLWGAILAIIYFNENNKKLIDSYLKPWVGYLLIMFISLIIIFPFPQKESFWPFYFL